MQIDRIKATNIEMTDAIRTAVETELMALAPITARYDGAAKAEVEVGKTTQHHHKGPFFRAEINLSIPGGLLRAEAEHEDLYTSIKDAAHKLRQELVKEKDRHDSEKRG